MTGEAPQGGSAARRPPPRADPSPAAGDRSVSSGTPFRQLSTPQSNTCANMCSCRRSQHPARRPGRVLRLGRAAGRPAPARPAGDRRRRAWSSRPATRRRRAASAARWAARQARRLCPEAIVVPPRMAAYTRGEPGRVRDLPATPPRWSRGSPSTRRSSTWAGLRRLSGSPAQIADPAAPDGPRAGRAADHRRGGPDEVPGQGGQRGGQTGRPAGGPARRRAGVPAPAAGGAALGRRPGHRRRSCAPGASTRSARSPASARPTLVVAARRGRRPASARAGPQPRPPTGAGRPPALLDGRAARPRPPARTPPPTSTPPWPAWSTG